MRRLLLSLLTALLAALPNTYVSNETVASGRVSSDPPATAAPEAVGLARNRLSHIAAVMNRHVAEKQIPGASGLIARRGKIAYQQAFGMADMEAGTPMRLDTIHRIYSMSKPITSVAVLMLYEEGKFQLNDPVAKYLPEFGKMQVGIEEKDLAKRSGRGR